MDATLVSLLEQALQIARGGSAASAPAGNAPASGMASWVMPFGKYKGSTLSQILAMDAGYIAYVRDKFGIQDGRENPQYAAKNREIREYAAFLLAGGASDPFVSEASCDDLSDVPF